MLNRALRAGAVLGLVLPASACLPEPTLDGADDVVERFHDAYAGASLALACGGVGLEAGWSAPDDSHPLVDHYRLEVRDGSGELVHEVSIGISGAGTEVLDASVVEACAPSCTVAFVPVDGEGLPGEQLLVEELVVDADGDGHVALTCGGTDCGDDDATIFPGAVEACDGRDNSCSGTVDNLAPEDSPLADLQDGVCAGAVKVCDGAGGWTEPDYADHSALYGAIDSCDGHDNDCDGVVDDVDPADAPVADLQDGVCAGSVKVCDGAGGWIEPDYASIADYGTEACDGLDNDCNGLPDDLPDAPVADLQDGVCAGSVKVCDGSGGWTEPDYGAIAGYGPEACDGLDNDCSGAVDDIALVDVPPADLQDGVCAGSLKVCDGAGGWIEPDYAAIPGHGAETCDGLDNDCNGQPDDLPGAPLADLQDGVCAGSMKVCDGVGGWVEPDYTTLASYGPETCDGLDNDCSGAADDIAPADVPPADLQDGVCSGARKVCDGSGWVEPDYFAHSPLYDMVEACDGVDNTCSGVVDDVDPAAAPLATLQDGVCAGSQQVCASGEWTDPDYALIADYGAEACDGLDNDCNGADDDVDPALAPPADLQAGVCSGATQTCSAGMWIEPDYYAHSPLYDMVEACDGVDNTCSGVVDDVDPAAAPLATLQDGVCAGSQQVCASGEWTDPDYALIADYGPEACDGLDNDCNGAEDDVDPALAPPADLQAGVCSGATKACLAGIWEEPDYYFYSGLYSEIEDCDGYDNTCSGAVDDVALLDVPLADAQLGVCSGALKDCDGTNGWVEPDYLAWDPAYEPVEMTCDGLDNDCEGTADTVYAEDPTNSSLYCWGRDRRRVPDLVDAGPWRSVAGNHVWGNYSYTHSCAIDTADQLYCWGDNGYGQLGDGAYQERRSLAPVSGGGDWSMVSAGAWSTCGVQLDGTLWCWGARYDPGELYAVEVLVPEQVGAGSNWASVTVGTKHRCALETDGTLWCWGHNDDRQLGIDVADDQASPYQVGTDAWLSVSAGVEHTCGVQTDGSLWCWGYSSHGAVGAPGGVVYDTHVEVAHPTGLGWLEVGVGDDHSCALADDGAVWCWGYNYSGQLGDGTNTASETPVLVSGGPYVSLAVGDEHVCATDTNDDLWCWGRNDGRVGDGTVISRNAPVPITGGPWSSVGAGYKHTCAIAADGSLWCWGEEWANGTGSGPERMTWRADLSAGPVANGNYHTCFIDGADGSLWCFGDNGLGQLGTGAAPIQILEPARVGTDSYVDVAAGGSFTCAIDTLGHRQCWGINNVYQLGDGGTVNRDVPWTDTSETWKVIGAGGSHACAIRSDDTLWCWGSGTSFQLGAYGSKSSPTQVGTDLWQAVDGGYQHSCGIQLDGSLLCWGTNNDGELGDGTTTTRSAPTLIAEPGSWRALSTSEEHTCAIKTDDTLWCWGKGSYGQLGHGDDPYEQLTPVQVPGAWESVITGDDHTCGIQTDGTAWCWGSNYDYQMAMDYEWVDASEFHSPVQLDGTGWTFASAAQRRTCAVQSGFGQTTCGAP